MEEGEYANMTGVSTREIKGCDCAGFQARSTSKAKLNSAGRDKRAGHNNILRIHHSDKTRWKTRAE